MQRFLGLLPATAEYLVTCDLVTRVGTHVLCNHMIMGVVSFDKLNVFPRARIPLLCCESTHAANSESPQQAQR